MLPFREVQRQKKWWIALAVTLGLACIWLFEQAFGMPLTVVPVHLIVPGIITATMAFIRLEVVVDEQGIRYKFAPIPITKETEFNWNQIQSAKVIRYEYTNPRSALLIKISEEYGLIFRMGAKDGLLVTLCNGKKMFFGTRKPEELRQALIEFGQSK